MPQNLITHLQNTINNLDITTIQLQVLCRFRQKINDYGITLVDLERLHDRYPFKYIQYLNSLNKSDGKVTQKDISQLIKQYGRFALYIPYANVTLHNLVVEQYYFVPLEYNCILQFLSEHEHTAYYLTHSQTCSIDFSLRQHLDVFDSIKNTSPHEASTVLVDIACYLNNQIKTHFTIRRLYQSKYAFRFLNGSTKLICDDLSKQHIYHLDLFCNPSLQDFVSTNPYLHQLPSTYNFLTDLNYKTKQCNYVLRDNISVFPAFNKLYYMVLSRPKLSHVYRFKQVYQINNDYHFVNHLKFVTKINLDVLFINYYQDNLYLFNYDSKNQTYTRLAKLDPDRIITT